MKSANIYSIWHLNLMYSSIEEDQRFNVIKKCFWPLIELSKQGFKIGIEIPANSLEIASTLDPDWIEALKIEIKNNRVELVGSGHSQLISPLVPFKVNTLNLSEAKKTYRKLLDTTPTVWLINEQTFSEGLIDVYQAQGIDTVIIDWNESYSINPQWPEKLQYYPFRCKSDSGKSIQILWSNSIAFQKFQRYIHGQIEKSEYFDYLKKIKKRMSYHPKSIFCFYGNDAEIFDFRPGRFAAEPTLNNRNEWTKISELLSEMLKLDFNFCMPSEALVLSTKLKNAMKITNMAHPVCVKKQPKYNITRWALTGNFSPKINQICYDVEKLMSSKNICELWSSDYRTHLTKNRWDILSKRLQVLEKDKNISRKKVEKFFLLNPDQKFSQCTESFKTSHLDISINALKGMTIDQLSYDDIKVFGRIPHGTFSRMDLSSDLFSGNVSLQLPGTFQYTDLNPTNVNLVESNDALIFTNKAYLSGGTLQKAFSFSKKKSEFEMIYSFDIPELPIGSLRFGFLTFHLGSKSSVELMTHLGGPKFSKFKLPDFEFGHGDNVNNIVSAHHCLGMTENVLFLNFKKFQLQVELTESTLRPLPMIEYRKAKEGACLRLYFSLSECDETRKNSWTLKNEFVKLKFKVSKGKK